MRFDSATFKMAYEAHREHILKLFPLDEQSPSWIPIAMHEAFQAGHRHGFSDAMEFRPGYGTGAPSEFDWEFQEAWQLGYDRGSVSATLRRDAVWEILMRDFLKYVE